MTELGMPQAGGALNIARHLGAAQAKWDRLTAVDYAGIRSVGALIAAVAAHYSLPHHEAKTDVELWLRDVGA